MQVDPTPAEPDEAPARSAHEADVPPQSPTGEQDDDSDELPIGDDV